MNKYIIEYSSNSKPDIIEIKKYIKYNLQEPIIANNLIAKIRKTIEKLANNPELYSIIDDDFMKKQEIRKVVIDNYIVFYRIKDNFVEIIRVIYGKRNWIKLM